MNPQRTLNSFANISLYRSNRKPPRAETTMPWIHRGMGIAFALCAVAPVIVWWIAR